MKKNILFGLGFLALAVLVLAGQYGILHKIGMLPILLSILFGTIVLDGLVNLRGGSIFFGLAFLAIIWDDQLGITKITPWWVLIAAVFATVGFELLFKGVKKNRKKKKFTKKIQGQFENVNEDMFNNGNEIESDNGEYVYSMTKFGSTTKYLTSSNLKNVDVNVSFGAAIIYFDKAEAPNGVVHLNVDCKFGGIKIYVPQSWQVSEGKISKAFSGMEIKKGSPSGENKVTLFVDADLDFSGLEIFYI